MAKDTDVRHVAVAVVYDEETRRILMVTSRKHDDLWILPKGGVEKGETSGQAAVREAWEEGEPTLRIFLEILLTWVQAGSPRGLPVPTDDDLLISLTLEPVKKNKPVEVWHVHALKVSERSVDDIREWPEKHERSRKWFTLGESRSKVEEWYSSTTAEAQDAADSAKSVKKNRKGNQMDMALAAFAERVGWT